MRLAIADPPYLGRARRWYGEGRGSGGRRHVADFHPAAADWDRPEAHAALVEQLAEFDGWAIAAAPDSLGLYLSVAPSDVRVLVWHRRNAPPSGSRVGSMWEPVIVRIPPERRAQRTGLACSDVLDLPGQRIGFAGSKPPGWTRWVLDVLGYTPDDELLDIFAGSGSVAAAADGMLALVSVREDGGRS